MDDRERDELIREILELRTAIEDLEDQNARMQAQILDATNCVHEVEQLLERIVGAVS